MTSALQATSFKSVSIRSQLVRFRSISKANFVLIPSKPKAGGLLKISQSQKLKLHNSLKNSSFWKLLLRGKLWWWTLVPKAKNFELWNFILIFLTYHFLITINGANKCKNWAYKRSNAIDQTGNGYEIGLFWVFCHSSCTKTQNTK